MSRLILSDTNITLVSQLKYTESTRLGSKIYVLFIEDHYFTYGPLTTWFAVGNFAAL